MRPPNVTLPVAPPPLATLTPLPPLIPPIPDTWLLLALPIITYWSLSLFFHYLDTHDLLNQYRLHTPAEVLKRNHVSRAEVIREVVMQHVIQTIVGAITACFESTPMVGGEAAAVFALYERSLRVERVLMRALRVVEWMGIATGQDWRLAAVEVTYWYLIPAVRLCVAIFILDTWQYFLHRLMHESKWLYRTFHSRHHRLYVPYAFGALYNHPFEGLLMDTIGAGLAYKLSGMGLRGGMVFFCFSTMKTVDDHCGYALPWDPLQKIFWNNAVYHDVHHQSWGIKTNFSQPFLICWDRWLGTQWTGGDVSPRYAASAEKAAALVEQDRLAALAEQKSNGHIEQVLREEKESQEQEVRVLRRSPRKRV